MDITIQQVLGWVKDAGTIGILTMVVVAFFRGWVVPKWAYDDKVKECDAWKGIVDGSLDSVKQLVELAELVEPRQKMRR